MPQRRLPDADVERELFSLVKRERLARDTADWTTLRSLYWPDSRVRVTWFTGTAEEFVDVSIAQQQAGRGRGIHAIDPVWSAVDGDRALVESRGQILLRPRIDGVECDVTSWGRFFSRLERRAGEWRLLSFDGIYAKDRIDPVDPGATLTLDADDLARGRASYRHLAYLNRKGGFTVSQHLPGDDDPSLVAAFYADADEWLHSAR